MHSNIGLYHPNFDHDACGIGFIANLNGELKNETIHQALKMLVAMDHRGGCGCDIRSGDGAGILLQKPHQFFHKWIKKEHHIILENDDYGVAQIFLPKEVSVRQKCKRILEDVVELIQCSTITYRGVPVDNSMLGEAPLASEPVIEQLFIERPQGTSLEDFERKLFVIRNHATYRVQREVLNAQEFYIVSCSYKTIGYKGQFNNDQLQEYYLDFADVDFASLFVLIHSRFSTNTFPKWKLAQPFRYIAHNGEINTVKGNVGSMKAREALLKTTHFSEEEMALILPICDESESDSCNLDMMVEMLVLSGRSLPHVLMMLIPEAWQDYPDMEDYKRYFYRYYAHLMEPWDGPASICFTDGQIVGATLDRNGLRPSRYCLTKDGTLVMSSEVGVLDIDPSTVVKRGRLQPGKMFVADVKAGRIIPDEELKKTICSSKEYGKWVKKNEKNLADFSQLEVEEIVLSDEELLTYQKTFGYTTEDIKLMMEGLATTGKEPLGSMGLDTALPVLSDHAQHIANYFKQLFAQVTNPPIDPIREKTIMSLFTYLGASQNLLTETPAHCQKIRLTSPLLTNAQILCIKALQQRPFIATSLDIIFEARDDEGVLEQTIDSLCTKAIESVQAGATILILSDRDIRRSKAPIPSLMAVGAVHNALLQAGLRMKTSLILESADVRETHHVATAVGYGANAVNPYLALEMLRHPGGSKNQKTEVLCQRYIDGIEYGLRKILSKMGISTLQSYHGSRIFEALGLQQQVIDKCFTGTVSNVGGLLFDDLAREALTKHRLAFPIDEDTQVRQLAVGGIFKWKRRGEYHLFNPSSIHYLQHATRTNNYETYKKYAAQINEQSEKAATLRGLLTFTEGQSISIEEVESANSILKRFATGAMSFGSLSHEAHSTLAIAMNRIGAKSNSGEGGEDPARFVPMPNGDSACSAIKQVASGRFGVTSYYLSQAKELQIKMAQGAKPGEGGQLPGYKVDEWIGRVRHSTPGVGLISPPPHHDIYSIEDLAQLIFDLKNANRDARINVKLVSEAGVGTVAAGVAKGYADVVLIAGHDGGTGASPLTSIRHAGLPWELGLSETHQTLVRNGLRSRIVVQADGQMKTGRDLAIATLLGAEEWGVSTAALVVEGCILMRKCHLNTCPVGVATQDPVLRKRFAGKADHVVSFFNFLAEELREIMAKLGFRTINEMVGRVDRLEKRKNVSHWKARQISFDKILYQQPLRNENDTLYCSTTQKNLVKHQIDWQFIELAAPVFEGHQKYVRASFEVRNTDRAIGAMFSHEVSKRYQQEGLPQGTIQFSLKGHAGQSFGAFGARGITLELEGEANDYVGKGLSGAHLIVYPFASSMYVANQNMIIGNVALYGATSGELYANGLAGERFAVRNSGATAVVEGVGDHGCEYMTGGTVVVLGSTGRNFAAGMSGGCAYIYDIDNSFASLCNMATVELEAIATPDTEMLKRLIAQHAQYTKSVVALDILSDWERAERYFVKVMPIEYKQVLLARAKNREKTITKKRIEHG